MRKFKGGGSSQQMQPQEQKIVNTSLPDYVEPYFKRLLQRGEAESLQGYTPYGGQRLSYFSPDELQSQAMVRGIAQSGTPEAFTQAQQTFQRQADTPLSASYQAGAFDPGYDAQTRASQYQSPTAIEPFSYEQNISRFMSPYQQNVIDIQKREARRQSDIGAKKIQDAATASGGLGGYREAIFQAERDRNLSQQLDDIQQRGSQSAFESAQNQLASERQFGLQRFGAEQQVAQSQEQLAQQAFDSGQRARQQAAQLGLSAQQQEEAARQAQERFTQSAFDVSSRLGLSAGQNLLQAGRATQQDAISRAALLSDIGKQQRVLRQAGLDMGYEDFIRQRDYTRDQLGFYGNLLQGVPVTPQQQISTYQQQPGLFQTALGSGLSALGLYRGLGAGG